MDSLPAVLAAVENVLVTVNLAVIVEQLGCPAPQGAPATMTKQRFDSWLRPEA